MRPTYVVLSALLLLAVPSAVVAEEVLDTWADGSPRLRYHVDEQGRFHGVSTEYFQSGRVAFKMRYRHGELDGVHASFHENGKKRTRAIYRRGARTGKYEEWDDQGRRTWSAYYRNGLLHGKAKAWREGKAVASQAWAEGELLKLEGVRLGARSREVVTRTLAEILKDAEPKREELDALDAGADRSVALARLRAYRYLCGVPWADVVLDDACNEYAEAASRISAALERISHTPPNPGWPEEEYEFAAHGALNSNLHPGRRAADSIDGYMDDSDPTNVDRVGHRRWCLNPRMVRTGFGATRGRAGKWYTAMWANDESRAKLPKLPLVGYPAVGWMPVDLFGPRHAWSAHLDPADHSRVDPDKVQVTIHRLDARFLPAGEPLPLDVEQVHVDADGRPTYLVFRPAPFALEPGADHLVAITGLDPDPRQDVPIRYLVRWFERRAAPPTTER